MTDVPSPLSRGGQCLRWCFAALLAASALGKLADMTGFIEVVSVYRLLPGVTQSAAAWLLALGEACFATWLVSGYRLAHATIGVVLLHGLYFAWIAPALARGLALSNCGCFGVYWPRPLTSFTLLEDGAPLLAACALYRARPPHPRIGLRVAPGAALGDKANDPQQDRGGRGRLHLSASRRRIRFGSRLTLRGTRVEFLTG